MVIYVLGLIPGKRPEFNRFSSKKRADGEVEHHRIIPRLAVDGDPPLEAQRPHRRVPAEAEAVVLPHIPEGIVLILREGVPGVVEGDGLEPRLLVDRKLQFRHEEEKLVAPVDEGLLLAGGTRGDADRRAHGVGEKTAKAVGASEEEALEERDGLVVEAPTAFAVF